MEKKARKPLTSGKVFATVIIVYFLNFVGGYCLHPINNALERAAFEREGCDGASFKDLQKKDLKAERACKSDSECILVPMSSTAEIPRSINRDYICYDRIYGCSPPPKYKEPFRSMSCHIITSSGSWPPAPTAISEISRLFLKSVCINNLCTAQ